MTRGHVIVLLGISGVGKSHLARQIVRARPNMLRLSASKLLKSSLHTTGEKLRTGPKHSIVGNQSALVAALTAAREGRWEQPVLLEAHAFIDNDHALVDVPVEVMEALGVTGILALAAPASQIAERRQRDTRKRPERSVAELDRQQKHSLAVSGQMAGKLQVPLQILDPRDLDVALQFIDLVVNDTRDR